MISPYRRYTATEIDAANGADLPDLLASLGYQVRRVGSCYTTKEMDSLRIWNRRTWYRYSESIGGDAVAFLRHFHGMSFPEAVRYLLAFNGYPVDSPISPPRRRLGQSLPQEQRTFVLPRPHSDNRRVCTYLRGRGIASGVIDGFIEADLLYEDAQYHNCVFIGHDRAGKPVFAAKRGTGNIPFKCDVSGSDKRIAFRLPCDPVRNDLYVFESPIDLMSWFTLHGRCNAVALCGLHDTPVETYLHDNPHVKRIIFCLDADGPGREAAGRIAAKYRVLNYETEDQVPPTGKDWNEYLQTKHL